jgi:hypothetical protein
MVRNTNGGNKSKSFARKSSTNDDNTIPLPDSSLQRILCVTQLLGNGMFYASTSHTSNDNIFLCHIRNKFKGRLRRFNDVSLGKFVLVGLRHWEHPHFRNADLLFIYDHHPLERKPRFPLEPSFNCKFLVTTIEEMMRQYLSLFYKIDLLYIFKNNI